MDAWSPNDEGYPFDGVQYDTFYAPDPGQLEAEAIRRECACTSERFCLACYQRACKEGR